MYFEYHLPQNAPVWMDGSAYGAFVQTMRQIAARMEKLEEALQAAGMKPEVFAKWAKFAFDQMGAERFDATAAATLAKTVKQMQKLFDDGTPVPERLEWPNAQTVVDTRFVTTKEWESIRHIGIGGSDAAVVMGNSPYRTQFSLYHDKVGTPAAQQKSDSSSVFLRGHFLEDSVVNTFLKITGAKRIPEYRMFCNKKYPCVTANIDAIIELNGELYVYEAKTTIADNFMSWVNGKVPPHYVPQMRQYPAVLDDERIKGTFIGVLFTKDYEVGGNYMGSTFDLSEFKHRFLERDPEAEREQLEEEHDWWDTYVENNVVPPHTGIMEKELQALNAMAPQASGGTFTKELDPDLAPVVADWLRLEKEASELKKRTKALDEQRKALSLPLIEALGENMDIGIIKMDDGQSYEIKNSPRKGTEYLRDVMETLIDTLRATDPDMARRLSLCIVDNPCKSRTFSIKKCKEKTA